MKSLLKILGLFCVSFLLVFDAVSQQDPLYSQYMFNMQAINPSYTGIHNRLIMSFTSRFQWGSLAGSPTTYAFTGSSSFFNNKVGLGLLFVYDEIGVNKNTEVALSYGYKIQAGTNIISFGLQTSIQNFKANYGELNLNPNSIDDPAFQGTETATKPNFGAGVTFMNEFLYVAFSAPRLVNAEFSDGATSIAQYQRHYYLAASYFKTISPFVGIKPTVLMKGVDGAPLSFDINLMTLLKDMFWVGVFTRDFNTYGAMVQFEFQDAYRIGYSFETPTGDFIDASLNTHEIMISVDLAPLSGHEVKKRFF